MTKEKIEIKTEEIIKEIEEPIKVVIEDSESEEKEAVEIPAEIEEVVKPKGRFEEMEENKLRAWVPKTKLGKDVKSGKIKNIDEILESKKKIQEEQIVDTLISVKTDLISIGQSKGKFGGGKRRAWRQTQKKTKEGNVPSFSALAVVGDEAGHVGIGEGKAQETLPARDKAIRQAKLNLMKVRRACGGFDCACTEPHSIPLTVTGKQGSVKVTLIPAPQGTGLAVASELKKVLKLAGIKDVYSKTFGIQRTNFNLVKACIKALQQTNAK